MRHSWQRCRTSMQPIRNGDFIVKDSNYLQFIIFRVLKDGRWERVERDHISDLLVFFNDIGSYDILSWQEPVLDVLFGVS